MRKLPVYILVDVSESMLGDALDTVYASVQRMVSALRRNPYALETVWLSVIGFDSKARVLTPLTDICEFQPPRLKARPGTALGAALRLTRERIRQEVRPTTPDEKGDWRPMVFVLTDGQPTDGWRQAANELRTLKPRPSKIYTIGIGDDIDFSVLKEVGDVTFHIADVTDGRLEDLFVWMSASIQSASVNLEKNDDASSKLDLPAGIDEVGDDYAPASKFPRQLFFHFTCCNTKKNYIARFRYRDESETYCYSESYPVDDEFFSDSSFTAPKIDSEKMEGVPVCPYCGRQTWFLCFCKTNTDICEAGERCPHCGHRVEGLSAYSGSLEQSLG